MNEQFIDYYVVLEISKTATKEEVKKAYRKKARDLHPDLRMGLPKEERAKLEEKLKVVNEAYEVLQDTEERIKYDQIYTAHYEEQRRQEEAKKQEEARKKAEAEAKRRQWEREYEEFQRREAEEAEEIRRRQEERRRKREQERQSKLSYQLKKAYQEVKRDESKYTFRQRHATIDDYMYDEYSDRVDSIPKEIIFRIGQGTVHVAGETLYQLSKLRYFTKDSIPKFVIRNRGLLATAAAGVILVSSIGVGKVETPSTSTENLVAVATEAEETIATGTEEVAYNWMIVLNRNYTVRAGDTLSQLAVDSGTSMETIKSLNHFSSNYLYIDDVLEIPYNISNEDLQYYTENVQIGNRTIYDLAEQYETDVETLVRLNGDAIQKVDGAYIVLSDTVLVPNFITKQELKEIKENNQYTRNS